MKGLLLVNLGTPDAPTVPAVRRYLREFLSDPRVIDLPGLVRWLLLHLVILPFRPRRTAAAYAKVWDAQTGSPLLHHSRALTAAVARALGDGWRVELAMRYGRPDLDAGLDALAGCEPVVVLPLYPQVASSTTGSTLAAVYEAAARRLDPVPLRAIRGFYRDPAWVAAQVARIRPYVADADHLVLSFHGLPVRQVRKVAPEHCMTDGCCDAASPVHAVCYRAQCTYDARAIAAGLGLEPHQWTLAYQSRVGRDPWLGPSTTDVIRTLAGKRVAVACPSFVVDCLETLEEIAIGEAETLHEAGGGTLIAVPCLNDDPAFAEALAALARGAADPVA